MPLPLQSAGVESSFGGWRGVRGGVGVVDREDFTVAGHARRRGVGGLFRGFGSALSMSLVNVMSRRLISGLAAAWGLAMVHGMFVWVRR